MSEITFHPWPTRKRRKKRGYSSKPLAREKAWQAFSLYIRLRDGNRCLLGEEIGGCNGYIQAGHVIPKEKAPCFYFDERDVYGQCQGHNKLHRYNSALYTAWFIRRFGHEAFLALEQEARARMKNWKDYDIGTLRKIKSLYEHKIAELKSPTTA